MSRNLITLKYLIKKDFDIKTRDLFESMSADDQTAMEDTSRVSHVLTTLRDRGIVENGISEIINGKTALTWRITNSGRDYYRKKTGPLESTLEAVSVAASPVDTETPAVQPETTLETVLPENAPVSAAEEAVSRRLHSTEAQPTAMANHDTLDAVSTALSQLLDDEPLSVNQAVFRLELLKAIENAALQVINERLPVLTNLNEKIETLERIAPVLSADIRTVLGHVIDDLRRFQ